MRDLKTSANAMRPLSIDVSHETWPLAEAFTISRGSKTAADVVVVSICDVDTGTAGRGEAVPYARYGETIDAVLADITRVIPAIAAGSAPHEVLHPGAALNALDCAMWDFEAKQSLVSAATRAGVVSLMPVLTAYTLSLGTPEAMAAKARAVAHLPLLKLKLGGAGDEGRMRAVRAARPDARLIADANEAWTVDVLQSLMQCAAELGFETIEQPLPADQDAALAGQPRPVPLTADESVHTAADIPRLAEIYDGVNIKLDKAGGLTGALELQNAAIAAGLKVMVGSMVATSLAVAPALILAQNADWVDLDGPLLLARDRPFALHVRDGVISPADPRLWG